MGDTAFSPAHRRPARPAARRRHAAEAGLLDRIVDYLPTALFYALIVPAGLTFSVGDLLLFAYRAVLILTLPLLLFYFARRRHRIMLPDLLLIAGLAWIGVSFVYNEGLTGGIEAAGRMWIDMAGAYLIGRVCIRDERDLARFLRLILPGLLLVGIVLVAESVTKRLWIISLFPLDRTFEGGISYQYRLGLLRAFGPFQHAILGGLIMASFLTPYLSLERNPLRRALGVAAAATSFFTLSTAAIASLALQTGFLLYRSSMRLVGFRVNWWFLFGLGIASLAVLEFVSKSGVVSVIIRYGALNSHTGNYRLLIWEYGTGNVANHPLFGIGYGDWERLSWMTNSVDNYWLALTMQSGLPALVPLLAIPLVLITRLVMISGKLPSVASVPYTALMIALLSFAAMGFTVAFWDAALAYFYFISGACAAFVELYCKRKQLASRLKDEIRYAVD